MKSPVTSANASRVSLPPADYHMHTHLCRHAEGTPVEYARQACKLGLEEIGISEHCPMPAELDQMRMQMEDFDRYLEMIETARKTFPNLTIRKGIEAEYIPSYEEDVREFLKMTDWDYVLGSVHYLRFWNFDDPACEPRWKTCQNLRAQWELYFEEWKIAAKTGLYDSLAHPDLVKKFGCLPTESCEDLFQDALKVVADCGLCIEINTAGLRKPAREIYPSASFLQIAREYRIPITFGSDAHQPEEVGMNFKEAVQLARQCGYTEYVRFNRRQRILHPLNEMS